MSSGQRSGSRPGRRDDASNRSPPNSGMQRVPSKTTGDDAAGSTILVIGGPEELTRETKERISKRGHASTLALSISDGVEIVRRDGANLVVVVLPLAQGNGVELISRLRMLDHALPVVIAGKDEHIPDAATAFARGAYDHVADAQREIDQLLAIIGVAVGARKQDEHLRYLRGKDAAGAGWDAVVGDCRAMRKVHGLVDQICERTSAGNAPPIRISGETGTGKGLLAKTIHYQSVRRNQPFVDINCAAIPPNLMESELFGNERGAFTDAKSSRSGLFETASGGTLFLDEIGSLPMDLQAKLLTAIEEKKIRRVGGRRSIPVDVQVIVASHRNLQMLVKRREFREDLYHRLDVLSITLPPLRQRGRDKLLLAQEFIAQMCAQYGIPKRELAEDAQEAIMAYSWPGNIRELRNQIERIILLANSEQIVSEDFQFEAEATSLDSAPPPSTRASTRPPPSTRSGRWRLNLPPTGFSLEELEKNAIAAALKKNGGNVSKTARYLRISRQKLMYRMRKHGLES